MTTKKSNILWWSNLTMFVIYFVLALFADSSDHIDFLGARTSRIVLTTGLSVGLLLSLLTLLVLPKKWPVPLLCLVVYIALLV